MYRGAPVNVPTTASLSGTTRWPKGWLRTGECTTYWAKISVLPSKCDMLSSGLFLPLKLRPYSFARRLTSNWTRHPPLINSQWRSSFQSAKKKHRGSTKSCTNPSSAWQSRTIKSKYSLGRPNHHLRSDPLAVSDAYGTARTFPFSVRNITSLLVRLSWIPFFPSTARYPVRAFAPR
jgi:hypothetical protein